MFDMWLHGKYFLISVVISSLTCVFVCCYCLLICVVTLSFWFPVRLYFGHFILLHLFVFILWPRRWPISVNVPCALENNVSCSCWVWCSVTVKWLKLGAVFSSISLLIFCPLVLRITEKGDLKSPTIILALSISPVRSMFFAICNLKACLSRHMLI